MSARRRCLHFWRKREGWWSGTNHKTVFACSPCRRRWSHERFGKNKKESTP